MLAHLDLYAAHEHSVNVPGVPLSRRVTVFVGFMYQSNRDAATYCRQRCIGESLVRNAIHDDIDLLRFLIQVQLSTIEEVLAAIRCERKIQFRIDGESGITTYQWPNDVAEVPIPQRVHPEVFELGLKALNQRRIVSEVNRFINVVDKRFLWHKEVGRKITTHELKLVLAGEEHHLPMQNALIQLVSHGNTGVTKLLKNLCISSVRGARIDQNTHWDTSVMPVNQLSGKRCVLHKPEGDVNAYGLSVN